jgi:hypothetical protein
VTRRGSWTALAAAAAVLGAVAYPLGSQSAPGSVGFDDRAPDVIVLQTAAYRVTFSKQTGALVELRDRRAGRPIAQGTNGCEWTAVGRRLNADGCALAQAGAGVRYRWDARRSTLTLTYPSAAKGTGSVDAVVTVHALQSYLDLRLNLTNRSASAVRRVSFPADLQVPVKSVTAGYAPNFLPGVVFGRAFFRRDVDDLFTYPSRGAFADYLALDLGRASLAVYSVNPLPAPLAPVELGFRHGAPSACSGALFCVRHAFATWVPRGRRWTSPIVRLRVGVPVERSILDYRTDNRIFAYPSAAAKLGSRLPVLAQAPLVKIDPAKGLPPFSAWRSVLQQLPSPSLLHPAGFQAGGFDVNDPDFLPPDPRLGTQADYDAFVAQAEQQGRLVMPYLNASWWDAGSPTVRGLPPGLTLDDLSVQDDAGRPVTERFNTRVGYVVSPYVPFVRARVARLIDQFANADCLFFDQLGSRRWLYDFNHASPTPLAYEDGWLSLFRSHAGRCLMTEDGWDRMAAAFSGFHGGLPLVQRLLVGQVAPWGNGTWQPFPLALWLLHDKVLLYQHDLCECTFTTDPQILTWNLAFGFLLSYTWDEQTHSLASPWLPIMTAFQRALGPRYAGVALTSYTRIAAGVTETRFGRYSVVANWTRAPYTLDGYQIAPGGFLARTDDGRLAAAELAGASGTTYRIVEDGRETFSARVPN